MAGKIKKITILLLIIGKRVIKSVFFIPDGTCKYEPTCSVYAEQAIKKYSLIKAMFVIIWRIIRCNPLSKGGYDPII